MEKWAELLDELTESQVAWILEHGSEIQVQAGTTLVAEDGDVDAIYFVIDGLLHARTRALGGRTLAVLGPGEIVGEMSFVDRQQASASVVAAEDTRVLVQPRSTLEAGLDADPLFAARFYRALAAIASRRLRSMDARLGSAADGADEQQAPLLQGVKTAVDQFKEILMEADKVAMQSSGQVPEALASTIGERFQALTEMLHGAGGEDSDCAGCSGFQEQVGRMVQRELLPFLLMTGVAERMYAKPRGYPGDFSTIEMVYRDEAAGTGRLGPLLDRCFLLTPAARAIRSRRQMISAEIRKTIDRHGSVPAQIMAMSCGPATEVFDVCEALVDPATMARFALIDVDFQALLFLEDQVYRHGLSKIVTMTHKNLIYMALGRTPLDVADQDLVYSLGLIDHFNDNMVVRIIDHVHSILKPGGRLVLGTFHPRNRSKALFDHVLEWSMVHRTEDDMNQLFQRSRFARPCTSIRFEDQRIWMLTECVREE
jgi:CRP-like cAMP-binding protein/SAM-dependent methyltransferase